MRILTFADMGIGNFVFYLPVLRALAKNDLTVVCSNEQIKAILNYNIKCSYTIKGKYDVAVNNFLCQRKQDIKKIWGIPRRIGHDSWHRQKLTPHNLLLQYIFTDKVPIDQDKGEEYYNNKLLEPLELEPIFEKIKFPNYNMPKYDIVISRHSADPKKHWEHWDELIKLLKEKYLVKVLNPKEYPIIVDCDTISKCKVFIGNDSGMAKIAANLGIPTIQIFRWWTDCFVRCRIKGINLIEPSVDDVLCLLTNR